MQPFRWRSFAAATGLPPRLAANQSAMALLRPAPHLPSAVRCLGSSQPSALTLSRTAVRQVAATDYRHVDSNTTEHQTLHEQPSGLSNEPTGTTRFTSAAKPIRYGSFCKQGEASSPTRVRPCRFHCERRFQDFSACYSAMSGLQRRCHAHHLACDAFGEPRDFIPHCDTPLRSGVSGVEDWREPTADCDVANAPRSDATRYRLARSVHDQSEAARAQPDHAWRWPRLYQPPRSTDNSNCTARPYAL